MLRLLTILWMALAAVPGLAAAPSPLEEWRGEFFAAKQGGIYLQLTLAAFKASAQTSVMTGNVQILIQNLLEKQTYLVSYTPAALGAPRELWKLPSGKYQIRAVIIVDTAGVKRIWKGSETERHTFVVKRQCLTNLGLWTLSPQDKSGLALQIKSVPNTYKEEGAKADSSVAAVYDGVSGLLQETLGGKKVLAGAANNYEQKNELRATVTFTRQIAVFYKLDLFKHNFHAKSIASVLSVYDPNIRQCYTDRLDDVPELKGDVTFTFLLSKETGTMAKLKRSGGSATDPKLAQCMYFQLGQIQFPVPENMVGQLTYTFSVQ